MIKLLFNRIASSLFIISKPSPNFGYNREKIEGKTVCQQKRMNHKK